jgi:hypothetical protein
MFFFLCLPNKIVPFLLGLWGPVVSPAVESPHAGAGVARRFIAVWVYSAWRSCWHGSGKADWAN